MSLTRPSRGFPPLVVSLKSGMAGGGGRTVSYDAVGWTTKSCGQWSQCSLMTRNVCTHNLPNSFFLSKRIAFDLCVIVSRGVLGASCHQSPSYLYCATLGVSLSIHVYCHTFFVIPRIILPYVSQYTFMLSHASYCMVSQFILLCKNTRHIGCCVTTIFTRYNTRHIPLCVTQHDLLCYYTRHIVLRVILNYVSQHSLLYYNTCHIALCVTTFLTLL